MGYRYDYLVAELTCARCGALSPADLSTEMTTRLRRDPELAELRVGDQLPVDLGNFLASGYLLVRKPVAGEPVRLLQQWMCPTCGYAFNWAEVVLVQGTITQIRAVDLNQAALAGAHFIADDAAEIAAHLAGVPRLADEAVVHTLRRLLPTAGGWRLDV